MDEAQEIQVEENIYALIAAAEQAALDVVTGKAMGPLHDRMAAARDAAVETGADVALTGETMSEWHGIEGDLMRHCDAIECLTIAARVANVRDHTAENGDAIDYIGGLESGAHYLVRYHAQELHRLVVAMHDLAESVAPTLEQIRAARSNQTLFDHSLPELT